MRHIITPRVGQFLSTWVGYIIVATLFRTMTSQAAITPRQFLQVAVVGLVIATLVDLYTRRRKRGRQVGKRRRH